MKLSRALGLEKTNVNNTGSQTFNAPGNYVPPYGKVVIKVGGRGASGNPTTYPYAGTNPPSYYTAYNPPGAPYYVDRYTSYVANASCPSPSGNLSYSYNGIPSPSYISYTSNYGDWPPSATGAWFGTACTGYDSSYGATFFTGIPATVNESYSVSPTPGNSYNVEVPGNAYYNTVPGNAGTPTNIQGVYFPGGAADSLAPVVSPTATSIAYETSGGASGINITTPTGGYVTMSY